MRTKWRGATLKKPFIFSVPIILLLSCVTSSPVTDVGLTNSFIFFQSKNLDDVVLGKEALLEKMIGDCEASQSVAILLYYQEKGISSIWVKEGQNYVIIW